MQYGCSTKNWECILNSLIYEANIEPFCEQQKVLKQKYQRILMESRNSDSMVNDNDASFGDYKNINNRETAY